MVVFLWVNCKLNPEIYILLPFVLRYLNALIPLPKVLLSKHDGPYSDFWSNFLPENGHMS